MQTLILTLHIIVCFLLVILILLQSGKDGMGVIFGGGNSSVFGSTGAGGILAKLTTLMAVIFIITSLSYTYVTSSHPTTESAILNVKIEDVAPAPADTRQAAPVVPETPAVDKAAPDAAKPDETVKPAETKSGEAKTEPAASQKPEPESNPSGGQN